MTLAETGLVLGGKYRLETLIGHGGMGSVWRAEHLGLNAPVAVKLLNLTGTAFTAELVQRFYREARAAANIRSPHVVQILDYGLDETLAAPFIVMELMEGESLADRLTRLGSISPAEVAHVFTHVARALTRAHEAGIVHRDLKPDNVFLVRNEDEVVAKVLDFGIAKAQTDALKNDSGTRTGAVMGTAYYMSPEQISGAKNVDFRTDLWAFGVMACECLTGVRPFDAESIGGLTLKICIEPVPAPSALGPTPAGFDAWFMRSVSRDPAQRFASAREAADALRAVLTGEVGRADNSGSVPAVAASGGSQFVAASSFTTGQPLSVTSSHAPAARHRNFGGLLIGLAGGVLVVALGAMLWLRHARTSDTPAMPSASTGASTPVSGDTPATVAASTARPPALAVAPTGSGEAAPSASNAPVVPSASPIVSPKPYKHRLTIPGTKGAQPPVDTAKTPAPAKSIAAPTRDVIDDRH